MAGSHLSSTSNSGASAPVSRRALGRQALVLGIVSISSPLALNMYVPAFPRMAADLGTDPGAIQLSLTSLLVALALGQNIYGPLSDRFGRKGPLYFGLGLFVLASIAVAFAPSLEWLVAWRFVQGLGACAAMAIPRAVVRDLYTGSEAARIMALVILVISVAPLLAPMIGSALALLSWRYIFWFMAGTAAVAILLLMTLMPESLPPERRTQGGAGGMLRGYGAVLRDRYFVGVTMMMALSQASFFAYLGGSPFVFMTLYGLEGWQFGLLYGITAAFWAGSAQLAPMAMDRLGPERLLTLCGLGNVLVMISLFVASFAGWGGAVALVAAIVLLFSATGMMMPTATVAALHHHGAAAGTASALMGTAAFALGAVAGAFVSALADGSELPMIGVMTGCNLIALASAWLAFGGRERDL